MFLMRQHHFIRCCLGAALAAGVVGIAGPVAAKNDFDALLAEITFDAPQTGLQLPGGDAPAEAESTPPVAEAATPPADSPLSLPADKAESWVTSQAEPETADAADPAPLTDAAPPLAEATAPVAGVPEEASQTAPVPTQPVVPTRPVPTQPVPAEGGVIVHGSVPGHAVAHGGDGSCSTCGPAGHRGHGAFCQPYVPPRLPSSTFYQYWRTNACNVNVWDGFRNRCHNPVDLSIKHEAHRCGLGACASGHCVSGHCTSSCESGAGTDCGPLPAEWCDQAG
jgi:hypothetical protein